METDLLFSVIKQKEWKAVTESGSFSPGSLEKDGYIRAFTGAEAEAVINRLYAGEERLILVVLDPLRIQQPLKHISENGNKIVAIHGAISLDVIIDKIKLRSDTKGRFSLQVKHFD